MSQVSVRRLGSFWIVGMLALVAAGCAVGPHYHPPQIKVPGQWVGTSVPAAGTTSIATPDAVGVTDGSVKSSMKTR
jgi:hypothetical protein